jgi:hypothetical protein
MDDEQSKAVSRSTMQSHDKGISVIGMHIKSENQSSYLPYSYHYNILYKLQNLLPCFNCNLYSLFP